MRCSDPAFIPLRNLPIGGLMRRSLLGLVLVAAMSVIACGSTDTTGATGDAGPVDGTPSDAGGARDAAPVGAGEVTGSGGFAVYTAKWSDPGPFAGKPRLEVSLSDDAACDRATCSNFHELWLRLSGAPGASSVGPGTYSIIVTDAGGVVGNLEAKLRYGEVHPPNGCAIGEQPGTRGTVTVDTLTATEIRGTFALDILPSTGGTAHLTGSFDALGCP